MDFGSTSYGISKSGLNNFVTELNTVVLTQVTPTILNTGDVKNALRAGWHGVSEDNFEARLDESARNLSDSLKQLQQVFQQEMDNIEASIADMDAGLFQD